MFSIPHTETEALVKTSSNIDTSLASSRPELTEFVPSAGENDLSFDDIHTAEDDEMTNELSVSSDSEIDDQAQNDTEPEKLLKKQQ